MKFNITTTEITREPREYDKEYRSPAEPADGARVVLRSSFIIDANSEAEVLKVFKPIGNEKIESITVVK